MDIQRIWYTLLTTELALNLTIKNAFFTLSPKNHVYSENLFVSPLPPSQPLKFQILPPSSLTKVLVAPLTTVSFQTFVLSRIT